MDYAPTFSAIAVFAFFVSIVLGISFYLGSKAKSAQGYYAAHGEIPWLVNGVAFAGDYLSAASFLGICGMIAFYGYDGFLYSIGFLAGWIVALLVIAEPLKRLGRFTFADALDSRFHSKGIKLAAAISTLVVSLFYLIPQMVGAGTLIKPLLGLPHYAGVISVGVVVVMIVVTAGMVSTTWVQFIKGGLLVVFCTMLTVMILQRGLTTEVKHLGKPQQDFFRSLSFDDFEKATGAEFKLLPRTGDWAGDAAKNFFLVENPDGRVRVWHKSKGLNSEQVREVQSAQTINGKFFVNGVMREKGKPETDFIPVGRVVSLPSGAKPGAPLGPLQYLSTFQQSEIETWSTLKLKDGDGFETAIYYPTVKTGNDLMLPGASPTFKGVRSPYLVDKLNFYSLMLALFCGTASLPHILIRYYTVKDESAARKSTVVGIGSIGFFYILTLYLGLGAMTSGVLDPTNTNMAAPLLAKHFGELSFAIISAIAFTTVLGTVSGLILAASGAVAHDLLENFFGVKMTDHEKVRAGKLAAVVVGAIAMVLGILFENFNVTFLVGWAFNIAASANLPALIMLLFWQRTTKQGITASILVGMFSSLAWVLLSGEAFKDLYGLKAENALVPFSQPALVTVPLGFLVLIVVSLLTPPQLEDMGEKARKAAAQ
ncbi:Cation/acetate symporter ActP [Anatilimnocola aggregata]|uniref:Cation/acetate symporter ActP n=1 Tax=Anatilimnocola aggregata TaxID=2528021 RepID=A0A517YNU1_9BACT|nr:cation acetate symporter [Anatilimnocola aggregata]QDU31894.1 Cation/acetate symporter ActP [Anatilimnocola aggregata]